MTTAAFDRAFVGRLKLRPLVVFAAIAEAGRIGAAADALHISQPAVTKAIRELEATVGAALYFNSISTIERISTDRSNAHRAHTLPLSDVTGSKWRVQDGIASPDESTRGSNDQNAFFHRECLGLCCGNPGISGRSIVFSDRLNMRTPTRRIGDIECLRGVAVVMVIFYHAPTALLTWPMPLLQHIEDHYLQTWPGVDLFFAISGFVIARTLLPSLAASEDKFRLMGAFWTRRFWRLVPSAWAWLGVIMVACVLFNRSGVFETFHTNFESALAAMLSVANFREAAAFKNFPYGPSATYWSLSLEEQFYIILPVLAYLSGRWLLPVLLVITIAVFNLPYLDEPLVMMLRVHAILLGVLLAMASDKPAYAAFAPGFLRDRKWAGLLLLLFLVVMISVLAPYGQRITSYPLDLIAILCAVLVFIASHDQDFLVGYRPIRGCAHMDRHAVLRTLSDTYSGVFRGARTLVPPVAAGHNIRPARLLAPVGNCACPAVALRRGELPAFGTAPAPPWRGDRGADSR
jgi:peptidoglycan/LPS O-acetylase OafA/YrhL